MIDILIMLILDQFNMPKVAPYEPTGNEFIEWTGLVQGVADEP